MLAQTEAHATTQNAYTHMQVCLYSCNSVVRHRQQTTTSHQGHHQKLYASGQHPRIHLEANCLAAVQLCARGISKSRPLLYLSNSPQRFTPEGSADDATWQWRDSSLVKTYPCAACQRCSALHHRHQMLNFASSASVHKKGNSYSQNTGAQAIQLNCCFAFQVHTRGLCQ